MTTRKKALGVDPLSWIRQTPDKEDKLKQKNIIKKEIKPKLPKFETYDVKVTLRISDEHLSFLTNLEREIMKRRSKKNRKERITKNSIIRSIIEVLEKIEFDKSEISNEEELIERIFLSFKKNDI